MMYDNPYLGYRRHKHHWHADIGQRRGSHGEKRDERSMKVQGLVMSAAIGIGIGLLWNQLGGMR